MGKIKKQKPAGLELEILKVLWKHAPQTVREIRDALASNGRDLAHTTVITTLGKMVDKLQIEKLDPVEGKAFRFAPRIERQEVTTSMLGDVAERLFDGSSEALMLSLLDTSDLDEAELIRLRKMLNQKIRETRS